MLPDKRGGADTVPMLGYVLAFVWLFLILATSPFSVCLTEETMVLGLGQVRAARFSPNSNEVFATSSMAGLQLWDTDGALLEALDVARASTAFDWDPGGSTIAAGCVDGGICLFERQGDGLFGGRPTHIYSADTSAILSVSYSETGRRIAFGTEDGTLGVIDISSGQTVDVLQVDAPVDSVTWSPDGTEIVALSATTLRLANLRTLDARTLDLPARGSVVSWSPDASSLAIGDYNGMIYLANALPGWISSFKAHTDAVNWLEWSRDGALLASSSAGDCTARIWNMSDTQKPVEWLGLVHLTPVFSLSLSSDTESAVSVLTSGRVVIWTIPAGRVSKTLDEFTEGISSASWAPARTSTNERLLAGAEGSQIKIWDVSTGRLLSTINAHDRDIQCLEWSPDGQRIASASLDRAVKVWNAKSGTLEMTLLGHTGGVLCLSWSPDGQRIASGSRDGTIMIWEPRNPAPIGAIYNAHGQEVACVTWSPDGEHIASSSHSVRIWNVESRQLEGEISTEGKRVQSVRWSPDGSVLALYIIDAVQGSGTGLDLSCRPNGTVAIFDLASNTIVARWSFPWNFDLWQGLYAPGHLAWAPDGSALAFATGSHPAEALYTLSYWRRRGFEMGNDEVLPKVILSQIDLSCGYEPDICVPSSISLFEGFAADVSWVGFTADGCLIGAASWDGTIRVIALPDGSMRLRCVVQLLCVLSLTGAPRARHRVI